MSLSTEKILTEIWALLRGGINVTNTPAAGGSTSTNATIVNPVGQQTMAASVGVVLASNQSDVPVKGGFVEVAALTAGALNADLVPSTDVSAYKSFGLQILGTWSGTLTFQGSNDNSNFLSILLVNVSSLSSAAVALSATSNGIFVGDLSYRYLRVRMTAYASGTATGVLELYGSPAQHSVISVGAVNNISTIGTSVTPGTAAANLGKAEDAAHASGDTGIAVWAVRNDANAAFSTTDLDYTPQNVDSAGRSGVRPFTYGRVTADGQIKASAGVVHTVTIAATGAVVAGVLTLYDSLSESGTVILSFAIPTSLTAVSLIFDTPFATGLFVGYDATLANVQVTCTYQ